MNDKNTTEKGASSEAPAKADKPVFYLFEKKKQGINIRDDESGLISRQSENNVLVLDPGDKDDQKIIKHLSGPRVLEGYRGKRIKSLAADEKMTLGERLDELLTLSPAQLAGIVPKSKRKTSNTVGEMIAAIIEKEV